MSVERSQDLLQPAPRSGVRRRLGEDDDLASALAPGESRLAAAIRARRSDPFALVGWLHGVSPLERPVVRLLVLRELGAERGARLLGQAFGGHDVARSAVKTPTPARAEERAVDSAPLDADAGRAHTIAQSVVRLLVDRDAQAASDALTLIESLEPSLRPFVGAELRRHRLGSSGTTAEEALARRTNGHAARVLAGHALPDGVRFPAHGPLGRREGTVSRWLDRTAERSKPMVGGRLESALDRGGRTLGLLAQRVVGDTLGKSAVVELRAFADAAADKLNRPASSRAVALDRNVTGQGLGQKDEQVLSRADGERLPLELEQRLGALLGHDFSHVRIHTDDEAAGTAERLGANALTVGSHIFFNRSAFRPGTAAGDRLLVHELTHVVQHDEGRLARTGSGFHVTSPSDHVEREAKAAENKAGNLASAPASAPKAAAPKAAAPAAKTAQPRAPELGESVAGDWRSNLSTAWDYSGGAVVRAGEWTGHKVVQGAEAAGELAEGAAESLFESIAPAWMVEFVKDPAGYIVKKLKALIDSGMQALASRFSGVISLGKSLLELASAFETAFEVIASSGGKQQACCSEFAAALTTIKSFATKLMHNPAVSAVKSAFAALDAGITWMVRVLGGAVFDFFKEAIPAVWQEVESFRDSITSVVNQLGKAKDWLLGKLAGLGLDLRGGSGGLLDWVGKQLAPLWAQIKQAFSIDNLKKAAMAIVALSPLGPILYLVTHFGDVVSAVEQVVELWQHRNDPAFLKNAQSTGGLKAKLLQLFNAGGGLLDKLASGLKAAGQWIARVVGTAMTAVTAAFTALGSSTFGKWLGDILAKIGGWLQSFSDWAEKSVAPVGPKVDAIGKSIWTFVEPYVEMLGTIATCIVFPPAIAGFVAAAFWHRLEPCIKEPIVDLLLDVTIDFAKSVPELAIFGPLWSLMRRGFIGFLTKLRGNPKRVALFDGIAKMFTAPAVAIVAFVKGFLTGVVDNVIFPFQAIMGAIHVIGWVGGLMQKLGQQSAQPQAKGARADVAAQRGTSVDTVASQGAQQASMPQMPEGAEAQHESAASANAGGESGGGLGFLDGMADKLVTIGRNLKASFDQFIDATKGGLVEAIRGAFKAQGGSMSFQSIVDGFGALWGKVLDKVESMSGEIADKLVEAFSGDPTAAISTVVYWIGYVVGTVVFQVVIDALTAGAYTFIGPVVIAIARFINLPAELLGPAFKLMGKLGKYLPTFVKDAGAVVGKGAFGFLEKVLEPLDAFGKSIVDSADQLAEMWSKAGQKEGANAAEGFGVKSGLVRRTKYVKPAKADASMVSHKAEQMGFGAGEKTAGETAEKGTEHAGSAHAPESKPTVAEAAAPETERVEAAPVTRTEVVDGAAPTSHPTLAEKPNAAKASPAPEAPVEVPHVEPSVPPKKVGLAREELTELPHGEVPAGATKMGENDEGLEFFRTNEGYVDANGRKVDEYGDLCNEHDENVDVYGRRIASRHPPHYLAADGFTTYDEEGLKVFFDSRSKKLFHVDDEGRWIDKQGRRIDSEGTPLSEPLANGYVAKRELSQGSGGLSEIFLVEAKGAQNIVVKVDRYDVALDSAIREVQALEKFGGPKFLGETRIRDLDGRVRPGFSMELVDGTDMSKLTSAIKRGADAMQITDAHIANLEQNLERIASEGQALGEVNLGDFMLTNDGRVVPLDMMLVDVKEGGNAVYGQQVLEKLRALKAAQEAGHVVENVEKPVVEGAGRVEPAHVEAARAEPVKTVDAAAEAAAAGNERARELVGKFEPASRVGSCKSTCDTLQKDIFLRTGERVDVWGVGSTHFHLRMPDGTIIDPTIMQFFKVSQETAGEMFTGTADELVEFIERNRLKYGFREQFDAFPSGEALYESTWKPARVSQDARGLWKMEADEEGDEAIILFDHKRVPRAEAPKPSVAEARPEPAVAPAPKVEPIAPAPDARSAEQQGEDEVRLHANDTELTGSRHLTLEGADADLEAFRVENASLLARLESGEDVFIATGELSSTKMAQIARATNKELTLLRVANDGSAGASKSMRVLRLGDERSVSAKEASRVVAHTHPDGGMEFSPEDEVLFDRLGQRSSVLVRNDGAAARLPVEQSVKAAPVVADTAEASGSLLDQLIAKHDRTAPRPPTQPRAIEVRERLVAMDRELTEAKAERDALVANRDSSPVDRMHAKDRLDELMAERKALLGERQQMQGSKLLEELLNKPMRLGDAAAATATQEEVARAPQWRLAREKAPGESELDNLLKQPTKGDWVDFRTYGQYSEWTSGKLIGPDASQPGSVLIEVARDGKVVQESVVEKYIALNEADRAAAKADYQYRGKKELNRLLDTPVDPAVAQQQMAEKFAKDAAHDALYGSTERAVAAKEEQLTALRAQRGPGNILDVSDQEVQLTREIEDLKYANAPLTEYEKSLFKALDQIDPLATELGAGERELIAKLDQIEKKKKLIAEPELFRKLELAKGIPERAKAKLQSDALRKIRATTKYDFRYTSKDLETAFGMSRRDSEKVIQYLTHDPVNNVLDSDELRKLGWDVDYLLKRAKSKEGDPVVEYIRGRYDQYKQYESPKRAVTKPAAPAATVASDADRLHANDLPETESPVSPVRDTIARETAEARDRIASSEMQGKFAEPADMTASVARVEADMRSTVARNADGSGTNFYDKLMADPSLEPEAKARVIRAMTRTTEHYADIARAGDAAYQEVNRLHTLGEIDQVLDATRKMNLSGVETEDALLSSIFSDSHKMPGLQSLLTHNQDGADAAAVYLARELGTSPDAMERIARIRAYTKEHQIGPPGFMSKMLATHFNITRSTALRVAPFTKPLAELATPEEIIALDGVQKKIADPLNPAYRNAVGDAVAFTPDEQKLIDGLGIHEWPVPRDGASHAVIAGDSAINYASPEGTAKIVKIRGPGTGFKDKTVQDSIKSAFDSAADARTVLHAPLRDGYDAKVLATHGAVARAEAEVDAWLRSIGRDPAATPFWRNTPLDYMNEGDVAFAVEMRDKLEQLLRDQQSTYVELGTGSRAEAVGVAVDRAAPKVDATLASGVRVPGDVVGRLGPISPKRHRFRSISQSSIAKDENTVVDEAVWPQVTEDFRAIKAGEYTAENVAGGVEVTVNGRKYRYHAEKDPKPCSLYPTSGPGFTLLERNEYKALGVLNSLGLSDRTMGILRNMGATGDALDGPLEVYLRNRTAEQAATDDPLLAARGPSSTPMGATE